MVRTLLGVSLLLTGCLTAPELKDCIDFPIVEVEGNAACGGDKCSIYCQALVDICPEHVPGENKLAACAAGCGEFIDPDAQIDCRLEQLRAARSNPSACDNASIGGGSECGANLCDEYCFRMNRDCSGMFSSVEQCKTICDTYPTGGSGLAGNSIECRLQQITSDAEACNAASIASDGTCGSTCEGYCFQVATHCTGDQALFADTDACLAACEFLPQGSFDDWNSTVGANSAMCRAYHGSAPARDDPATHCPHASLYFDSKCGSICDTYCAAEMCGGDFDSTEACVESCIAQINAGTPLFPDPAATVQCNP